MSDKAWITVAMWGAVGLTGVSGTGAVAIVAMAAVAGTYMIWCNG